MSGDVLSLIRGAKPPERSYEVSLRGDLQHEYDELERRLSEVDAREAFAGSGEARKIAKRMEEIAAQIKSSRVTLRLRALGSMRSAALVAAHPPREGDEADKGVGYNRDTFYAARIRACCYAIKPRDGDELVLRDDDGDDLGVMSDEDWAFLDRLSHAQFDGLIETAIALDHSDPVVPTSPLASLISQRGGESSKQRDAGGSAPAASKGGSRGRSRKSSTTKPGESFG